MEIRPGSVKQARLEAGLSLGDVARGDISRTAIYFVETGKAKPSMETLQLIADRTGQPVDFFLAGSEGMQFVPAAKLAELERLLATGDNTAVVTAGEAALDTKCDPDTEARIRLVTSLAHLRLAQPVVGRRLASAAREHFERAGDLMMVAEALGNEASAAYLMEDASAVKIARGALATVRSLKPVPKVVESRLLSVLGHTLIASRDWQGAIECYEEAIRAADVVQDLYKLSLMYSGLSVAYQELGQLDQAGRYAQKALAIHQTLNDRLSLARSENNLGILLLRAGDVARAEPHIERALSLFEQAEVETGKAQLLLSLAELLLAKRDLATAESVAREAVALAERHHETGTTSDGHYWLAQVALARDDQQAVDVEFAASLADPDDGGSRERHARYRAAYADVLERRGDLAAANQQLKLALAALGTSSSTSTATPSIAIA